jgi:uncharacterized membrane protein
MITSVFFTSSLFAAAETINKPTNKPTNGTINISASNPSNETDSNNTILEEQEQVKLSEGTKLTINQLVALPAAD